MKMHSFNQGVGALAIAAAFGISACSSGVVASPEAPTSTSQPDAGLRVVTQPDSGTTFEGRATVRVPALGGLELAIDPSYQIANEGEVVSIKLPGTIGEIQIALVSADATDAPIADVAAFLAVVEADPTVVITPLDERVEILGVETTKYRFVAPPAAEPSQMFLYNPIGFPSFFVWGVAPSTEIYLGNTPNGVLAISNGGDADGDFQASNVELEKILPTLRLTGDPLAVLIDYGSAEVLPTVEREPAPVEPSGQGPDVLDTPFVPLMPGEYRLGMTGQAFSLEVTADDWWNQPLFPGFVVFAEEDNPAPGIRDIVLFNDMNDLYRVTAGPGSTGEQVKFDRIQEVLDSPPKGLLITNIDQVEVGGQKATRFDANIADDAACTAAEPCLFSFVSGSGVTTTIKPYVTARLWFFEDLEHPFTVVAGDFGTEWLDEAESFVNTFDFETFAEPE